MNTLIQSLLEAQEAILRNELELDTAEDEMAFESAINGNISDDYGFDMYSNFDSLLAMESEDAPSTDSGEKKSNWLKSVGGKIKEAAIKVWTFIKNLWKSIGEGIHKWVNELFKKNAAGNKQVTKANETNPALVNKVKSAATAYNLAVTDGVNRTMRVVENTKQAMTDLYNVYISDGANVQKNLDTLTNSPKITNTPNIFNELFARIDDTKAEFRKVIDECKENKFYYLNLLEGSNDLRHTDTIKKNAQQLAKTCFDHYKFCDKFIKAYESKKNSAEKLNAVASKANPKSIRAAYDTATNTDMAEIDKMVYDAAKIYLDHCKSTNKMVSEYKSACAMLS